MSKRSEEQKVTQAPVVVILGGKEYKITPLVIRDSRVWRSEVSKALGMLPQYAKVTTEDPPEMFGKAIDAMLVVMPDLTVDLFFSYAKELDRDEIEGIATDSEIAKAFEQLVEIAFPLAQSLTGTMTIISQ